ncbi:hypothetical protein FACS1894142_3990 [Spirochaetia bacterium]|nr:hypothetical protein FACS1894142_3990 [Spirochaetia bacterium]GHU59359.1 hypothetical protein FACS189444_4510 [Spirochaetia bacterium]
MIKRCCEPTGSIHIFCAIESQCEYFITADGGLTNKKMDEIKIINPIDFVREMEGKMVTETILRTAAIDLLIKAFGVLDAERFIHLG